MLKRSVRFVGSHRLSALVLAAGFALLLLASCSSTPGFPSISTAESMRETEFQRDAALAKLQDTLEVVAGEREFIRSLEVEKNTTFEDLRRERAEFAALEKKLSDAQTQNEELTSQLGANQKELQKIRETHTRLNRMAQETLGEVSALRQRGENLQSEKEHFAQLAQSRDRRIMDLSREIDTLRAELLRHATTVQVKRSEGERPPAVTVAVDPETGAVSTEKSPSSEGAASSQIVLQERVRVVHPQSDGLGFEAFYDNTVTELKNRYARALEGEIAWDTFDIVVVLIAGVLLLGVIFGLIFFFRMRHLKRTVKRLRAQLRRKPQRSGVVAVPDRRTMAIDPVEQPDTRGNFSTSDQPSPEEFSPIFRSFAADEEVDYEHEEEYEQEQAQAHVQEQEYQSEFVDESLGEVQTVMIQPTEDSSQEERAGRRVIGAFSADESPEPGVGVGQIEKFQSTTTTTAEADSSEEYFEGGDVDDADEDFSATQMIPDSFMGDPTADPAPASSDGSGASEEEQELLDELKAIINKKLDT